MSASTIGVEVGRWTNTPYNNRFCKYCPAVLPSGPGDGTEEEAEQPIDTETHFLLSCQPLQLKRQCFLARLNCLVPGVHQLSEEQLVQTILCPANVRVAKLVNKYIRLLFDAREKMDNGTPPDQLGYRPPSNTVAVNILDESKNDDSDLDSVDLDFFNTSS